MLGSLQIDSTKKQLIATLVDHKVVNHLSSVHCSVGRVIDGHLSSALLQPRTHVLEGSYSTLIPDDKCILVVRSEEVVAPLDRVATWVFDNLRTQLTIIINTLEQVLAHDYTQRLKDGNFFRPGMAKGGGCSKTPP